MKIDCALCVLLLLAGCKSQNRFTMYGHDVVRYEGNVDVINNCCRSAISRLAGDLQQERHLDAPPPISERTTGWSHTSRDSGKTNATRTVLTCSVDGADWQMDILSFSDNWTIVLINSPQGNETLAGHLATLLSDFDVKGMS